jgi:hypothetical protein
VATQEEILAEFEEFQKQNPNIKVADDPLPDIDISGFDEALDLSGFDAGEIDLSGFSTEEPSILKDIAVQIPVSLAKAGSEFIESANSIGQTFESFFPKEWFAWRDSAEKALGVDVDREDINKALDEFAESLPKAKTAAGAITGTVTQFAAPFGLVSKGLKATGMANNMLRAYTAGAITDFAAFDEHEKRLSNFLAESDNPILNNQVTQYLASDKDDTELEGRIKQVLEGMALGGTIDIIGRGLRAAKSVAIAKRNISKVQKAAPKIQEAVGRYMELGYNKEVATEKALKALRLNKADFTKLNEVRPIDLSDDIIKSIPDTNAVAKVVDKAEGTYVSPNKYVKEIQSLHTGISKHMANALLGVRERIAEISPRAAHKLNQFELDVHLRTFKAREQVQDFGKQYYKLSKVDKELFKRMWLNQNTEGMEHFFNRHPELGKSFIPVRKLLTEWGVDGKKVGAIETTARDYLPRLVVDHDSLLKSMGLQKGHPLNKLISDTRNKLNRELSNDELTEVINKYIRTHIPELLKAGKTSHTRSRVFEAVTKDMERFYADPVESLGHYIGTMGDNIEKRRFLGYTNPDQTFSDVEAVKKSIGNAFASDLQAGNINIQDLNKLTDLVHVRMGQGEKSTARAIQNAKNFMYMGLLANPISAATQLGDIYLAAHINGIGNTVHGLVRGLTKKGLTKTDVGITQHAEDMMNPLRSHRWLDKSMKWGQFQRIDDLGKATILNGTLRKYQKLAKTPKGLDQVLKDYKEAFTPREMGNLMQALQSGKITPEVKYVLWNDLTKMQPVSLSEMPRWYLDNPNGRVLYALKTFTVKQLNRLYFDGFREIGKGNYKKGTGQLMQFAGLLTAGGMSTDVIKNIMQGREPIDFDDNFVKNLYKVAGTSDYVVNMAQRGDLRGAAYATIAPPILPMSEQIYKDIIGEKELSEWKSFQYVPVVGRMYHQWFGGGLEAYNERQAKEE